MNNSLTIHHEDTLEPNPDTRIPDPHQDTFSKNVLGFWMYLMTDCILFASLFATYAVLHNSTFGGPTSRDLFSLPLSFAETMILLFSSVTCGFAMLSALRSEKNQIIAWLAVTFLLGATFIAIELTEFSHLIQEGNSWTRSAFLSSFFTLVGTHGLHVSVGLLWILVMMVQVFLMGVTTITFRRLVIFSMFWHFLDLIWIFIFTFVYLMGVI
jgi:cytochrome o ubiquinol oxidase subunit 3